MRKLVVGPFEENCYIVSDGESGEALVIDPGGEAEKILRELESANLRLKSMLLTHAHVDHVLAVERIREATGTQCYLHSEDVILLNTLPTQASIFGMPEVSKIPDVDGFISEGDTFTAGGVRLRAVHTPGHSPGGVTFVGDGAAFVGDTLFAGSVGRVDLPGGSWDALKSSIKEKLFSLDSETIVYAGHGPNTTIGHEKESNPFFKSNAAP